MGPNQDPNQGGMPQGGAPADDQSGQQTPPVVDPNAQPVETPASEAPVETPPASGPTTPEEGGENPVGGAPAV